MKVFVIIPAAGLGTRMASPSAAKAKKKTPTKQFKELGGVPILVHTLRKFAPLPPSTKSSSLCARTKSPASARNSKSNIRKS